MFRLDNFSPINHWHDVEGSPRFTDGRSVFIEDDKGQRFVNYTNSTLRTACAVHFFALPFMLAVQTAAQLARVLSIKDLISPQEFDQSIQERVKVILGRAVRIVVSPLTLVALEIAVIWGCIRPRDGQKLITNILSLGVEDQSVLESSIQNSLNIGRYDEASEEDRKALLPSSLVNLAKVPWSNISLRDRESILIGCPTLIKSFLLGTDAMTPQVVEEAMRSPFTIVFDKVL